MQSEQIINILHIGFIICLVLTILFAALSVFFFFQFKIRDVFNAITGRAQRKSVQQMEEENAKTKVKTGLLFRADKFRPLYDAKRKDDLRLCLRSRQPGGPGRRRGVHRTSLPFGRSGRKRTYNAASHSTAGSV